MKKTVKIVLLISLAMIGLVAGYLLMVRSVDLVVDGQPETVRTRALTVGGALRAAGYEINELDAVTPPAKTWLSKTTAINLDRARQVRVLVQPGGRLIELETAALSAESILADAGIVVNANDTLRLNGLPLDPEDALPRFEGIILEYHPAVTLHLSINDEERTFTSSADTIAEALWEAGIALRGGDRLSVSADTPLQDNMTVSLTTGRDIAIEVDGTTVNRYSAAGTVYEALSDSGITLQDLDYSLPDGFEPIPEDGVIKVVRVREELINEQKTIAFQTESIPDSSMEINQQQIIQTGSAGLMAARVKVRYENNEEFSREELDDLILTEPVTQIVHYGTRIVDNYLDTPEGPITYYLSLNVVATSYSPCRSGVPDKCYPSTKLGIPVKKGVIGVSSAWYQILAGTRVYVPGYGIGIIADTGSYSVSNWIDLGYSDADFISWGRKNTTVYFLSPAPPGFTGVLP